MPKLPTVTLGKATSQLPNASLGPATAERQPPPLKVPGITPSTGGVKKLTLQQAIEQAGTDVPALVIEELTGMKRHVILTERALPFAGSIKFCTELDLDESKYVGFPRINQTVLSVHDKETEMNGVWHERFLDTGVKASSVINEQIDDGSIAETVLVNGVRTPVELCDLFDDIARRASVLRVTWSHLSRVGRLATFEQDWMNLHDVKWRMLFKWIGKDDTVGRPSPPRTSLVGLSAAFSAAFNDAKDATAFDSLAKDLEPGFADQIDASIGRAQRSISDIADAVEARFASVTDAVDATRRVMTLATFVRDQAQDCIDTLSGTVAALMVTKTPDLQSLTNIDPGTTFAAACQQFGAIRAARALKHVAARQRYNALRNLDNNVIAIVKMRAGQDLRDLAQRWYDSPDEWVVIREFNHFSSSTVAAGTVVFIPAVNPP